MENNKEMVEAAKAWLNLSEYYFHAFGDGPGAKVLEDLEKLLTESCLTPTGAMDFQAEISPEQLMFMREGQNQVVRHIKKMIQYYKEHRNG
jgi:hypothetical protein